MACVHCGSTVPEGAGFCPRCGKPVPAPPPAPGGKSNVSPASNPPPVPGQPPPADAADMLATIGYLNERRAAFLRWRKRAKLVAIPAGVLTFVIVLVLASGLTKSGGLGMILAVAAGFGVNILVEIYLFPRISPPLARCPYCSAGVPILSGGSWKPTPACPNCGRQLPV